MRRTVFAWLIVTIVLTYGCSKKGENEGDKLKLPVPENDCVSDDNCSVTRKHYIEGNVCCATCTPLAGNIIWARKYTAACEKMGDEGCKKKKCKEVDDPLCVQGKCVLRIE